eukprot:TRINITY_DN9322_c0_g1_i1.p2 TRINITY_DN9322_c0_g1~~TRINITY_DN9322_c0_g1_i1.p2  ORF type:complete len:142 (+),score=27.63 TRINITY_DN9322_c0_g1_i1:91-516(+)
MCIRDSNKTVANLEFTKKSKLIKKEVELIVTLDNYLLVIDLNCFTIEPVVIQNSLQNDDGNNSASLFDSLRTIAFKKPEFDIFLEGVKARLVSYQNCVELTEIKTGIFGSNTKYIIKFENESEMQKFFEAIQDSVQQVINS